MSRALFVASVLSLGGCYPEFQFDDGGSGGRTSSRDAATTSGGGDTGGPVTTTSTTGTGSGGASGTSAGGGGDTSTTMSSTSSGPMPATTPCGPASSGMLHACEPDQVCCYDLDSASADRCDAADGCDGSDYVLSCDEQSDCTSGGICCALYYDFFGATFDGSIGCYTSCPSPNRKVCKTASDCGGGTCGPIDELDSTYGGYYKVCQ
ncbi:MAG TPA: hypothetical protein VL400_00455 [Polyangiaceae bacterium]|nr:hypothetical protein [Polyangiaceae bacterium]